MYRCAPYLPFSLTCPPTNSLFYLQLRGSRAQVTCYGKCHAPLPTPLHVFAASVLCFCCVGTHVCFSLFLSLSVSPSLSLSLARSLARSLCLSVSLPLSLSLYIHTYICVLCLCARLFLCAVKMLARARGRTYL